MFPWADYLITEHGTKKPIVLWVLSGPGGGGGVKSLDFNSRLFDPGIDPNLAPVNIFNAKYYKYRFMAKECLLTEKKIRNLKHLLLFRFIICIVMFGISEAF